MRSLHSLVVSDIPYLVAECTASHLSGKKKGNIGYFKGEITLSKLLCPF